MTPLQGGPGKLAWQLRSRNREVARDEDQEASAGLSTFMQDYRRLVGVRENERVADAKVRPGDSDSEDPEVVDRSKKQKLKWQILTKLEKEELYRS